MNKSLLFLPDISGFTEFVQSTEAAHSQHVIAELLEILLKANNQELVLAEIEGDALFFYKEGDVLSLEKLLAQVETMFTAFHSHLKLLEKNRICPCNACKSAPNLELKIIAHCGELQFITVQDSRKPFGASVIEAHRLMKNSVDSDNYVLLSKSLSDELHMQENYHSKLYNFNLGANQYDGKELSYVYSVINNENLKLNPFGQAKKIQFKNQPLVKFELEFPIAASELLEYITNYTYRYHWVDGVDSFEFNEHEITRLGTQHACVINGKHLNFVTVTKKGKPGQLIYGEMTDEIPFPLEEVYQFYILTPQTEKTCKLAIEAFTINRSFFKKLMVLLLAKRVFNKNIPKTIHKLRDFVLKEQ